MYIASHAPVPTTHAHHVGTYLSNDRGGGGGGGGYAENWSSLIGIITAIIGNVLISFALNMQRYAHIRLEREWQAKMRQSKTRSVSSSRLAQYGATKARHSEGASDSAPLLARRRSEDSASADSEAADKHQSYLTSPYWWTGIVLMTVGEAGNFLAYGFAPASIVSPLGVVALISNGIIAPFMLKEPFRARDALGVVIAVGGAVTVVLSANDSNPKLGPDEMWHLITRWEFEAYFGTTVAVIAGLMVASNRVGERSVLVDLGLVGLLGGYTALSTKGVSSLLSYTLWRAITFPIFYLLLAILVATAVMQIKYVNRALQRFDATQVIPVQFVLFTLSVIGGSAVLYRDFERTSADDAAKFVGGCLLTFFGVWLITTGRPAQHDEDEQDGEPEPEPELEDAVRLANEPCVDQVSDMASNANPRHHDTPDLSRPATPTIALLSDPTTPTRSTLTALSSLTANPWTAPNDPTPHAPSFNRHTSTPVLPSEAAPSASLALHSTSATDTPFPSAPFPSTPPRENSHPELPSTPGSQLRRLRTNERPGPRTSIVSSGPLLASPLSTTLSAMVQDMKRGLGATPAARRRRESVLGLQRPDLDPDPMLLLAPPHPDHPALDRPPARERSLSATLGELWRGFSLPGRGGEQADGQEEGPRRSAWGG